MKILLLTLLGLSLVTPLPAQEAANNPPAIRLTAPELNELLGPVALYPDALIALILPAATVPADVVLGARYVASGGNPAQAGDKSWASSVKALTRYPDTLKWLDENLEWTSQVGDAFIEQPVEVMESIQQLRAKARALGNLVDTPEQRIVLDDTDIRIIPAQPDYIYEPRYDPEVIYYDRPSSGPLLFFSVAYGVGSWLNYDCDWRHHRLYQGEWHEGWDYSRDRSRRENDDYLYINNNLKNSRVWHPDPVRHRVQPRQVNVERAGNSGTPSSRTPLQDSGVSKARENHSGIAHPKAIAGTPHRGETVRRAEHSDGKAGNKPSIQPEHSNKSGDSPKGHVATPKSAAPGMAGDSKRSDHKKPATEPEQVIRRAEAPSKKEAEDKAHADAPRHESAKKADPRHAEATKHQEAPKREEPRHEAPKHVEAPKHQDAPKHEAPKHKDAPKHTEAPKSQAAPKRAEAPKHEAPKRQEAPRPADQDKEKGKKGDKKDDDKKKK